MSDRQELLDECDGDIETAAQLKTYGIVFTLGRYIQSGLEVSKEAIRKNQPDWTDAEVEATFRMYEKMRTLSPEKIEQTVRVSRTKINDLGFDPEEEFIH